MLHTGESERKEAPTYARENEHRGGFPDQIDEGLRYVRENVLPQLQQQDGFEGMVAPADRQTGKTLGIPSGRAKKLLGPVRKRPTECAKPRRRL
jgi:hypothetical protein